MSTPDREWPVVRVTAATMDGEVLDSVLIPVSNPKFDRLWIKQGGAQSFVQDADELIIGKLKAPTP